MRGLFCVTELLVPFCEAVRWDEEAECRKWHIVIVSCIAGGTSGNEGPVTCEVTPQRRRTETPGVWMFVDDTFCVPVEVLRWVCGKFLRDAMLPLLALIFIHLGTYCYCCDCCCHPGPGYRLTAFIFRCGYTRSLCLTKENQFNRLSCFVL